MFSSPCRVLDTLFHLISPRFCEVDENLASGRPGDLPESHSEEVAGLGFRSCLTFCAAGRGGGGPQGLSSLHLPTPSVWGPLIWGTPQELLRAQGGPLPTQDPAWWETDAPPIFPPHLNGSSRPRPNLGRLQGWGDKAAGRLGLSSPHKVIHSLSIRSSRPAPGRGETKAENRGSSLKIPESTRAGCEQAGHSPFYSPSVPTPAAPSCPWWPHLGVLLTVSS